MSIECQREVATLGAERPGLSRARTVHRLRLVKDVKEAAILTYIEERFEVGHS